MQTQTATSSHNEPCGDLFGFHHNPFVKLTPTFLPGSQTLTQVTPVSLALPKNEKNTMVATESVDSKASTITHTPNTTSTIPSTVTPKKRFWEQVAQQQKENLKSIEKRKAELLRDKATIRASIDEVIKEYALALTMTNEATNETNKHHNENENEKTNDGSTANVVNEVILEAFKKNNHFESSNELKNIQRNTVQNILSFLGHTNFKEKQKSDKCDKCDKENKENKENKKDPESTQAEPISSILLLFLLLLFSFYYIKANELEIQSEKNEKANVELIEFKKAMTIKVTEFENERSVLVKLAQSMFSILKVPMLEINTIDTVGVKMTEDKTVTTTTLGTCHNSVFTHPFRDRGDRIVPGPWGLNRGEYIHTPDCRYCAIMHNDCTLAIYDTQKYEKIWMSETGVKDPSSVSCWVSLVVSDVKFSGDSAAVYICGITKECKLIMRLPVNKGQTVVGAIMEPQTGLLQAFVSTPKPLPDLKTCVGFWKLSGNDRGDRLLSGSDWALNRGDYIRTSDCQYYAMMQYDGNFVVYKTPVGDTWSPGHPIWSSKTQRPNTHSRVTLIRPQSKWILSICLHRQEFIGAIPNLDGIITRDNDCLDIELPNIKDPLSAIIIAPNDKFPFKQVSVF